MLAISVQEIESGIQMDAMAYGMGCSCLQATICSLVHKQAAHPRGTLTRLVRAWLTAHTERAHQLRLASVCR